MKAFLFILAICQATAGQTPVVKTAAGKVQGKLVTSYKGYPYIEFRGIPYAEAPTGKLRFSDPIPAKPWKDILVANTSYSCLQVVHSVDPPGGFATGVEDCLQLNLYVPGNTIDRTNNYDVIVHFHGGAFMFSNKQDYQGPKFIMDRRSAILIAPNYRLGIYGFLSTGDKYLPGNYGLKDQAMVLRWIRKNIKYFGGNPKSVTITGFSAGGSAVHYHMMSPMSRGLFTRGISASGVGINAWALQEKPLRKARIVGKAVGCPTRSSKALAKCLRKANPEKLNLAIKFLRPWLYNPFSPIAPIPDPWSESPFLPVHPYLALKKGLVADVPWLTSFVTSEGLYPAAEFHLSQSYLKDLDQEWTELAPNVLHFTDTVDDEDKAYVSRKIRKEYLGNLHINNNTYDTLVKIVSDRLYIYDIDTATRLQANVTKSPVWAYEFDYFLKERLSLAYRFTHTYDRLGVCHGDDQVLIYSDGMADKEDPLVPEDEKVQEFLLDIYMSFAKTGTPDIEGWNPVSKKFEDPLSYLYIGRDTNSEIRVSNDIGNGKFWRSLPFQENEHLFENFNE